MPSDASSGIEKLAADLRRAWQKSGLSLREVVRRSAAFSDRSYLSRALNGKQTLSLPALEAVARVLGLDHRQLLAAAGMDETAYRSRFFRTDRVGSAGSSGYASITRRSQFQQLD